VVAAFPVRGNSSVHQNDGPPGQYDQVQIVSDLRAAILKAPSTPWDKTRASSRSCYAIAPVGLAGPIIMSTVSIHFE
jgi:hypothetical protein